MEQETFKSYDVRDFRQKIGIAETINMKKAIELKKKLSARYWAELARIA